MTRCEWIVCERANCWAPALRMALANPVAPPKNPMDWWHVAVVEVRSLAELSERCEGTTNFVAFVEVSRTNLDAVLSWLARKSRENGYAIIAAPDHDLPTSSITAALREAGAVDIVDSPRRLQSAIRLGFSHIAAADRSKPSKPTRGESFEAWARSLLPWQAAR